MSRVTSFGRKGREVLLARLKGGCIFPGSALKVHAEPNGPNYYTDNASGDVLSNFHTLLVG
jgi:hypothetical protein